MSAPDIGAILVVVRVDHGGNPVLFPVRVISAIADGVVGAWYAGELGFWRDMSLMLVDEGTLWARAGMVNEKALLAAYALLHSC